MSFISTRGGACVTASQAILRGLAPDGGLYVPAVFPQMTLADIAALTKLDYRARALTILRGYLDDFNVQELADAIASAYEAAKFDDAAIAPTKKLDSNTHVLELFHGPTLAFKDMALQLLPHLTTLSAKKNGENREVAILVATSGDTGKAALEGFKDVPGTSCTVFYPTDGVSDVQKLQMTTTGGENTHVIALNGNFDDAQSGVKALFSSADFHHQVNARGKVLSSANSINFGRLVPQIVYYFSAYADLLNAGAIALGDEVNFVVPTGNFGNILAGYYARSMGLPVKKLICASNRNNVLTDFFLGGVYDTRRQFFKTTSPSMDILISSNLERLLFECAEIPQIRNRIRNCWTHLLAYRLQYVPQRRGQRAQIPIRQSRLRRVIVRAERNRLRVVRRKHVARRKPAARLNHHQWEALPAGEFLYCFPNAAGAGQSAADTERHVRSQRQADIFQLRPRQPGFP
mgnify:CR=1 FL=1